MTIRCIIIIHRCFCVLIGWQRIKHGSQGSCIQFFCGILPSIRVAVSDIQIPLFASSDTLYHVWANIVLDTTEKIDFHVQTSFWFFWLFQEIVGSLALDLFCLTCRVAVNGFFLLFNPFVSSFCSRFRVCGKQIRRFHLRRLHLKFHD